MESEFVAQTTDEEAVMPPLPSFAADDAAISTTLYHHHCLLRELATAEPSPVCRVTSTAKPVACCIKGDAWVHELKPELRCDAHAATDKEHVRKIIEQVRDQPVMDDKVVFTVFPMTTGGEPLGHGARYGGADLVAAVAKLLSHEDVAYVEVHDGSCSVGVWR